jgi:hypothetical protein
MAAMARLAAASTSAGVPLAPGLAWSSALMPAPLLNPRPAPPRRTTLTSGSVAARSSESPMVCNIAAVREFRLSGRLSVSASTPSSRDTARSSMAA